MGLRLRFHFWHIGAQITVPFLTHGVSFFGHRSLSTEYRVLSENFTECWPRTLPSADRTLLPSADRELFPSAVRELLPSAVRELLPSVVRELLPSTDRELYTECSPRTKSEYGHKRLTELHTGTTFRFLAKLDEMRWNAMKCDEIATKCTKQSQNSHTTVTQQSPNRHTTFVFWPNRTKQLAATKLLGLGFELLQLGLE